MEQFGRCGAGRRGDRGITLVLVAVSIVAMMAMAALSIDVATLYLASAEAQRAADAAALAGARVLSLSGMTGDPANSSAAWPQVCVQATQIATAVATQNTMRGTALTPGQVTVSFLDKNGNNCGSSGLIAFGLNPQVKVKIQRNDIPLYFAPVMRAFFSPGSSRTVTVSATATAEVFNPSDSENFSASGLSVPVKPRCVKPWLVPNLSGGGLGSAFFVNINDGSIVTPGINPVGGAGLIGQTFVLPAYCAGAGSPCTPPPLFALRVNAPAAGRIPYIPADAIGPYVAVPVGATGSTYQQASGGCDAGAAYACGTAGGANADLTVNPSGVGGDTSVAVQSLTRLAPGVTAGGDELNTAFYPFRILAGTGNPLVTSGAVADEAAISASNSIVTLPIYDGTALGGGTAPPITIVGFLQVFITGVNPNGPLPGGSLNVTILNVSGCGNGPTGNIIGGTSPVPVRLVQ